MTKSAISTLPLPSGNPPRRRSLPQPFRTPAWFCPAFIGAAGASPAEIVPRAAD
ncbi:MAG: hypothetical protein J0H49_26510 [Acidobacteria bacterium]|nr:hypothetical protein [Acidobacteriota bacterium]